MKMQALFLAVTLGLLFGTAAQLSAGPPGTTSNATQALAFANAKAAGKGQTVGESQA